MTPVELKTAALREIRVIPFDEVAPAEEMTAATQKYAVLHAMLLEMNLATWAVTEDIPNKCAQPVTWMLCHLLALPLAASAEIIAEFQTIGALGAERPSLAERTLRRVLAADYVPQTATAEYY